MSHSPRGSLWHRWDLHFHTPASFDYHDKSVSDDQLVKTLVGAGVRAVAITDHHTIDVARIRALQSTAGDALTIFPGIELRDDHGGQPVHYICIFPEACDLEHVWPTLQGRLGLTAAAVQEKGGDERVYVTIEKGAAAARELGGIVSIHAGSKSNSIEGIKNKEQFQQRIKYDITRDHVDLMEIGQLKDIDQHLNIVFPTTGLDRPMVICSDNHNASAYEVKAPLWIRADPNFRGLLMALHEPRDRIFIGDRPPELIRCEQRPTKYIRNITFKRRENAPAGEQWFNGAVTFNPGLVAVVGNKGSGKSALADTLGLLGGTRNGGAFSFLNENRFRHQRGGLASFFDATLEWESGETATKCLSDAIRPEEVERLKYLPQDHVENVCNELAGIGEDGFERELKSVIFSHVPDPQRLGHATLDELVLFQTGEKQKRIDSLLKQLREVSRVRTLLEAQADPSARQELLGKIARRQAELDAFDRARPSEVANPAEHNANSNPDAALLQQLSEAESIKKAVTEEMAAASGTIRTAERRNAVARRLLEKLDNFQKDFEAFKSSLAEDLAELGLVADELLALTVNQGKPSQMRDEAASVIATNQESIDRAQPPGLKKRLADVETRVTELQSKLDAPNRSYRAFLKALSEWAAARESIVGNDGDAESLTGLRATLAALDLLPARIDQSANTQIEVALQVHHEKCAQAEVFRKLYGSVQGFIDSHPLARDKLKLEFRAELTAERFADRLLELLALNRRGSFMGVDDGRARAEAHVQSTKWEDADSVRTFVTNVDRSLHFDQRDGQGSPVLLKDQLAKGRKAEEVFNLVFGLEYIRPRYILRWEGKELSMLSPGERGTLLLVFYLLIDKSDIPLVIDQPEGNLDNHTVAKVLVDCIKEARKRRQVFIVTHNPNLAVVCDADQVVHATMDKAAGNAITYTTGSLENPAMSTHVTNVLEGTRWAFDVRGAKYSVGETVGGQ